MQAEAALNRDREALAKEIAAACKAGVKFKTDGRTVYWHTEPNYETIDAEEWTAESWSAAQITSQNDPASIHISPNANDSFLSGQESEDGGAQETSVTAFDPPDLGREAMIFSPDRVLNWPMDRKGLDAVAAKVPRSTGLSRSTSSDAPFGAWMMGLVRPFCHVGLRRQPDLSEREGIEGPIDAFDLARLEAPENGYNVHLMGRLSPVLGASHHLMLPPHSSLAWYGRKLGWSDADVQLLSGFGSPARPESVSPKGDRSKLMSALRGVAALRVRQLISEEPGHILAQDGPSYDGDGVDRIATASEDLARWWLFVLLWRHDPKGFALLYPGSFLHVPDFVVRGDGSVSWSDHKTESHVAIWSTSVRDAFAKGELDENVVGGDLDGPRRVRP